MVSVFVSHSKHDKDLVSYFAKISSSIGLKTRFMEWEVLDKKYAGYEITKIIRQGLLGELIQGLDVAAVVVLLGENLERPPTATPEFTHNWVNFEVGVAAGSGKPVWVFEDFNSYIQFPIPYVTDYAQYNLDDIDHLRYFGRLFKDQIIDRTNRIGSTKIICPYQNCNAKYRYWSKTDSIHCPVCRQQIRLSSEPKSS